MWYYLALQKERQESDIDAWGNLKELTTNTWDPSGLQSLPKGLEFGTPNTWWAFRTLRPNLAQQMDRILMHIT